jgi:hypothetical protein
MSDYISLQAAKDQLSIDAGLTIHDARIELLIGASIDWAENYTQRSLGELLQPLSPADAIATPLPDPVDSPPAQSAFVEPGDQNYLWDYPTTSPSPPNPNSIDQSSPLRRDIQTAILLHVELLFDRNVDNWELIQKTAEALLDPYRTGMGV